MADTKISDLGAIETLADEDLFATVDVSDLSMAASGTNKKLTLAKLKESVVPYTGATTDVNLGAHLLVTSSGVKTGKIFPASDSTTAVQINKADGTTNVLNVDTTNGRVGIGTTAPRGTFGVKVSSSSAAGTGSFNIGTGESTNDYELRMGVNSSSSYGWISSVKIGVSTQPLVLQGTGGNLGIGLTSPTAVMHLKAGTATAGTAPLKFTSGTINTAGEDGAVEYNGTDFFITNSVSRQRIASVQQAIFANQVFN